MRGPCVQKLQKSAEVKGSPPKAVLSVRGTSPPKPTLGIGENATTVVVRAGTLGVAAPTTAVGVAEAAEAYLARVVGQDAAIAAVQGSTTGEVVAEALGADKVTAGTAKRPFARIRHLQLLERVS